MAYPVVADFTTGFIDSNVTSTSITVPTGTVAGDLMLLLITKDGTGTFTVPAGWTELANLGSSAQCFGIFYQQLTATLADFTIAHASEQTTWILLRIPQGGIPQISAHVAGSSVNPNPPALTHSFGAGKEVLWIGCAGWDSRPSTTAFPSNFPDNRISSNSTSNGNSGTAMATLNSTTNPQTPNAFTISGSDTWSAYTLAVYMLPQIYTKVVNLTGTDSWSITPTILRLYSKGVVFEGTGTITVQGRQLGVMMSLDGNLALRVLGTLIEGADVHMNQYGDFTVVELIEGTTFFLDDSGVMTIGELKEGQI